jgi:hypothetical protein
MAAPSKPAPAAPRFYVWQALGKPFSIELSLNVVAKLSEEQARATAEDPPRSISGVLLGPPRPEPLRTSKVEDFVLASGREACQSSFVDDSVIHTTRNLVEGADGCHIVGFFRVLSDGTLAPNDQDLTNASRLFPERDNVLLLIRFQPIGDTEAALFYWDHGFCDSGPTFAFSFEKLFALSQASSFVPPSIPDSVPPIIPITVPKAPTFVPPPASHHHARSSISRSAQIARKPSVRLRLFLTLAFLAVLAGAIQMFWPFQSSHGPPAKEATEAETSPLGLKVTSRPNQLEIRWNHDSAQILAAERAIMSITEGDMTERIPVDHQELREGYLAYKPKTSEVSIHFEAIGPGGRVTTEFVRVVRALSDH